MKRLIVFIAAFILVFGTVASRAANLDRISAETGVPVATLQADGRALTTATDAALALRRRPGAGCSAR